MNTCDKAFYKMCASMGYTSEQYQNDIKPIWQVAWIVALEHAIESHPDYAVIPYLNEMLEEAKLND